MFGRSFEGIAGPKLVESKGCANSAGIYAALDCEEVLILTVETITFMQFPYIA